MRNLNDISTEMNGRIEINGDLITVTTEDGRSKTTQIGNAPIAALADMLFAELAREGGK